MKIFLKSVLLLILGTMLISCNDNGGEELGSDFKLRGTVTSVGDRIEVDVIESEYAFGIYSVIIANQTVFKSASGKSISKDDIKVGDTVDIYYGGQVMMSYPPQIVAAKIVKN